MPPGKQVVALLETESYGGLNTAMQFSQIPKEQSPKMQNAYMNKVGELSKRPGTIPVSNTLAASIDYLTIYHKKDADELLCTSGTSMYKWNGTDTLTSLTGALNKSDIYTMDFTDANNNSRKIITDGSAIKAYDGTSIAAVTPAANDPSPGPANDMTTVNGKNPIYCWVYSSHVFVSDGSDTAWYSKRFHYDYFPQVQFERWVRENDYITGPGIAFNNICLIPMRRGWGFLSGKTVDDFDGNQYINSVNGCIAARSIQKITYPTGQQCIAFLSDDGVHEIYDTGAIDAGSRQYATRSLMKDKIDFKGLVLTDAEKKVAVSYYDKELNLYILCFTHGGENYAYCYDTRNAEWYPWVNVKAKGILNFNGVLYYVGSDKQLRKFDENLYSDWNDNAKTSGLPVVFKRYSPALALEFTGYPSYWDYYIVESKQWLVTSSLDITVMFAESTVVLQDVIHNEVFVWGASKWGIAKFTNANYTDIVNEPKEIIFHKRAKYCQVLWSNDRDEPVTIYKDRWKGRVSGR